MALLNECMQSCAHIVLDTADVVRDGDLRERIALLAKCDSPVRDCASRIFFERRLESLNGMIELEGVQQRHRPIEFLLRFSIA